MTGLHFFINLIVDTSVRLLPQLLGWLVFWFDALVVFLRADLEKTTARGCLYATLFAFSIVAVGVWGLANKPILYVLSILLACYIFSQDKNRGDYHD